MASKNLIFIFIYKILSLLTGLSSIYMGYDLFKEGIRETDAKLTAAFGVNSLNLETAAPGTFFALFGAAIICWVINKGLGFEINTSEEKSTSGDKVTRFERVKDDKPSVETHAQTTSINQAPTEKEEKTSTDSLKNEYIYAYPDEEPKSKKEKLQAIDSIVDNMFYHVKALSFKKEKLPSDFSTLIGALASIRDVVKGKEKEEDKEETSKLTTREEIFGSPLKS